jgi:hypothetical protein
VITIFIIILASIAALAVLLATLRGGPRVTTIVRRTEHNDKDEGE